jgi:phosphatidylserine decarboxylase
MPSLSFHERLTQNVWRLLPKRLMSQMIGWGARKELPGPLRRMVLRGYSRFFRLDCADAEHPIASYGSLQSFFARRLTPGGRVMPVDESLVVAPSDGTICHCGSAISDERIEAKGALFTLPHLLADPELAEKLAGGPYVAIYLSPRDYHRVHFPVGGDVVAWIHIPGKLFPVGSKSVKREPGLFARNERFVTVVDSAAGRYAVVMVAAVGVGHITASYDQEVATHNRRFRTGSVRIKRFADPIRVERGQELGIFNLGSTTITLFEPGRITMEALASDRPVRMGEPIARLP